MLRVAVPSSELMNSCCCVSWPLGQEKSCTGNSFSITSWCPGQGSMRLLSFSQLTPVKPVPFPMSFCTGQKQMVTPAEESQAFLQLTTLCQDRTLIGMKLLEKISSVPHGELSCSKFLAIFSHVLGPSRSSRSLLELVFPKLNLDPSCSHPYSSRIVYKFLAESPKFIKESLEDMYGKASPNLKSHKKVNL